MAYIGIGVNNSLLTRSGYGLYRDIINALGLPPYTIRVRYPEGVDPRNISATTRRGTWTQVSAVPNIWDRTWAEPDWSYLFDHDREIIEVIDANTTGVTNMSHMFYFTSTLDAGNFSRTVNFDTSAVTNVDEMYGLTQCSQPLPHYDLHNVTKFDAFIEGAKFTRARVNVSSAVTLLSAFSTSTLTSLVFEGSSANMRSIWGMCSGCSNITKLPTLTSVSNITQASNAFYGCYRVDSGIYRMYTRLANLNPVPGHAGTFFGCGYLSPTGSQELANIPSDWK